MASFFSVLLRYVWTDELFYGIYNVVRALPSLEHSQDRPLMQNAATHNGNAAILAGQYDTAAIVLTMTITEPFCKFVHYIHGFHFPCMKSRHVRSVFCALLCSYADDLVHTRGLAVHSPGLT